MERTALISVTDKSDLQELLEVLHNELKWTILSSGGTFTHITEKLGFKDRVWDTRSITGITDKNDGKFGDYYPKGLVKTLHPKIHAGLLYGVPEDLDWMNRMGIRPIHLVVVNLYDFATAAANPALTLEQVAEQIDIGGPSMLRSAAKGALLHGNVIPVCNKEHYSIAAKEARLIGEGKQERWSRHTAAYFAEMAFAQTAEYDAAITGYLQKRAREASASQ